MKKVSVIIPVYGVERYIAETVKSVLAQTYENFELLIVDDGSPDHSIEICQKFRDPRIKILRQPNSGPSAARNTGIRQAEGEYVAFLDGDDLWQPEKLAKHVQHLETSPEVGVSFCYSAFIDETGQPLGIYQISKVHGITPAYIIRRNPVGNGSAAVIRRQVLQAIEFSVHQAGELKRCYFDEDLHHCEDVECWLRIALQTSWLLEGIPEALTLYRVNSGGLSAKMFKQLEDQERMLQKTWAYAPAFITQTANPARAYQLRFVARRAVRLQDGGLAVNLIHQALTTYWRLFLEEPRRTLLTLGAAYLLWLLPQGFYAQLESVALRITGRRQKQQMLQTRSV